MVVLESERDRNVHFVNIDLLFLKDVYFSNFKNVCVCI